jgi:hypothetical protein
MIVSERTISNCSNCYSEDIDIDGGPYAGAALGLGSDRVGVTFRYNQYLEGDDGIESTLGLSVSGLF